jgi:hypothetical protein
MSQKILSTLKRLASELDGDSYAHFDLTLARICEGDVVLVDQIKRIVAPRICGGVGPRAWVQDTIDFLEPPKSEVEIAFAEVEDEVFDAQIFDEGDGEQSVEDEEWQKTGA